MPRFDERLERWLNEAEADAVRKPRSKKRPQPKFDFDDDGWDDGYELRVRSERKPRIERDHPLRRMKLSNV